MFIGSIFVVFQKKKKKEVNEKTNTFAPYASNKYVLKV